MGRVVIWKREIDSEVKNIYKSVTLPSIKGYVVQLELSDQIMDALENENDHLTPALMVEDAQEACAATVKTIAGRLKQLDEACNGQPVDVVEKAVKAIKPSIEGDISKLGLELKNVPKARWDKWVATKKQYKAYRWDCATKVTLGTLGAVGSGLAIAAAIPTGGATLALGIVGGARSGLELFKISAKMWVGAETAQKKVMASVETLQKIYVDTLKKSQKGGVKESGFSVINAILPLELAPTLSVVTSDSDLWGNKLAGIEVSADKKTKHALKLLKEADALEDLLKKSKSKDAKTILDKLEKMQREVDNALNLCTNESARVRVGRKAHEHFTRSILPALKSKQPEWVEIFDRVLPTFVNLALAGGGAGQGFTEASKAVDYVQASLDLANGVLGEIKAQLEA